MSCSASWAPKSIAVAVLFLVLTGCGKDPSSATWQDQVNSCAAAPPDQKSTFMAPIGGGPVQLLVDSTFNSSQVAGIHDMVVQWNVVGQALRGADFFTFVMTDVPDVLRSGNFQGCGIDTGIGAEGFYIVNETSAAHWAAMSFNDHIPGATIRCYDNGYLSKQVTYIRPDLVDPVQFTSVIIHELGHSIGLDHSCMAANDTRGPSASFVACGSLPQEHPYRDAVMFPTLGYEFVTSTPVPPSPGPSASPDPSASPSPAPQAAPAVVTAQLQVKDQVQQNDSARASCLY